MKGIVVGRTYDDAGTVKPLPGPVLRLLLRQPPAGLGRRCSTALPATASLALGGAVLFLAGGLAVGGAGRASTSGRASTRRPSRATPRARRALPLYFLGPILRALLRQPARLASATALRPPDR